MHLSPLLSSAQGTYSSRLLANRAPGKSRSIRKSRRGVRDNLSLQRSANIFDATLLPLGVSILAKREHDEVIFAVHEVFDAGRRCGGDDVQLQGDLATVCVQRQIVDVLTEGVFDFAADCGKTDDYVGGDWDC